MAVNRDLCHYRIQVERRGSLPRREFDEIPDLLRYHLLHQVYLGDVIDHPIPVSVGVIIGSFERVATEIDYGRYPKLYERFLPNPHCALTWPWCTKRGRWLQRSLGREYGISFPHRLDDRCPTR